MIDNHKGWLVVDPLTHDHVVVCLAKLRDDVRYTTWKQCHQQGQGRMEVHMIVVEEESNDNTSSLEERVNNNVI